MNPTYQEINEYLERNLPSYMIILQEMVSINSFTANSEGVNRLGEMTKGLFSELGFQAEFVQSMNPAYGKHLFLEKAGNSEQSIILISHLDTVFSPDEELQNKFFYRQENDRIYGPGTVDIKGGTLLIYMIFDVLSRFFPVIYSSLNWKIGMDATEEVLSSDFGKLIREKASPKTLACLVFEGGTPVSDKYSLVVCRKGKANFKVTVQGRSAHAGNRHAEGANAILQMAYTIQEIAELTNYNESLTFNVGTVSGGSVVNRVPHYAEAEVEMRTFSPKVFQSGVEKILALRHRSQVTSKDGFPCSIEIQQTSQTAPWPRNNGTDFLYSIWQEAGKELGYHIIAEERGGLSDGNLLWSNFPTLDGLGPIGNNAHCAERSMDGKKDQEFVILSSFIPKAILNIMAIQKLVSQSQR